MQRNYTTERNSRRWAYHLGQPFLCLLLCTLSPGLLPAQEVRWASAVQSYSSQYSERYGAASQALGIPDVPPVMRTPAPQAWSPLFDDSVKEFINLRFGTNGAGETRPEEDSPGPSPEKTENQSEGLQGVQQIVIVESFNPGAITRVYLESGLQARLVHEALRTAKTEEDYRIYRIFLEPTTYPVTGIRIELEPSRVEGYPHIDAVGISDSRVPIEPRVLLADFPIEGEKELLPPSVNSAYAEVHPLISPDGQQLYFTRKLHPRNTGASRKDDIWVARMKSNGRFRRAVNLGPPLNDAGHNYLNGFSADGQLALIAANYEKPEERERLYLARYQDGKWQQPLPLEIPGLENRNVYAAFHMGQEARTILLSLEREDSYGHKDLYVSLKDESGKWSSALNLGPQINTVADESTPYLAADGQTLYFSSNGRYGYGSADLWMSKRQGQGWTEWSEPRNLGPLINTPAWDANLSLTASGQEAYFTSFNPRSNSEDIYRIRLRPGDQIENLLLLSGRVLDAQSYKALNSTLVFQPEDGSLPMADTKTELPSGQYQILLNGGRAWRIIASCRGYYSGSLNLDLSDLEEYGEMKRDILLIPLRPGQIIPLPELAFEANRFELQTQSAGELLRVSDMMRENPRLKLEVAGHTNDRCDESFCLELSEKRARAVMSFLLEQGVESERLSAIGYGKSAPVQSNDTEEGRQANQRVELRILSAEP